MDRRRYLITCPGLASFIAWGTDEAAAIAAASVMLGHPLTGAWAERYEHPPVVIPMPILRNPPTTDEE